jgi:hypothetical protein
VNWGEVPSWALVVVSLCALGCAALAARWSYGAFQKAIERGVVGASIRNASPMPVYNVEIVYRDEGAAWTAIRRLHLVAPSDEPQIFAGFDEEASTGVPGPERINKDGARGLGLAGYRLAWCGV